MYLSVLKKNDKTATKKTALLNIATSLTNFNTRCARDTETQSFKPRIDANGHK